MNDFSYEDLIDLELKRQENNVELIASENFPSEKVLTTTWSFLTNKYS